MKSQILNAVKAHVMWRARLKTAIQSGESTLSLADMEADDRCELGKWLKGRISPELRNSPFYAPTVELHRQFHKAAGKVFALAITKHRTEALQAMETDGEFTQASKSLVAKLRAWHEENESICTQESGTTQSE